MRQPLRRGGPAQGDSQMANTRGRITGARSRCGRRHQAQASAGDLMTEALCAVPRTGHKWMAYCDIAEHDRSDIMFALDVRQ